jgi:hypothetical protein
MGCRGFVVRRHFGVIEAGAHAGTAPRRGRSMFSNAPTHRFVSRGAAEVGDQRSRGLFAWFLCSLQQAVCALHGHDAILQYERSRMFLRCTSCGYESPGWEVAANATLRHRRVEARAAFAAPGDLRDLAVARKIA